LRSLGKEHEVNACKGGRVRPLISFISETNKRLSMEFGIGRRH